MPLMFLGHSPTDLIIVLVIGLCVLVIPFIVVLVALRVFNEFQTQRRSEVVDQALTRDDAIAPLPAADEPAGTDRRA